MAEDDGVTSSDPSRIWFLIKEFSVDRRRSSVCHSCVLLIMLKFTRFSAVRTIIEREVKSGEEKNHVLCDRIPQSGMNRVLLERQ